MTVDISCRGISTAEFHPGHVGHACVSNMKERRGRRVIEPRPLSGCVPRDVTFSESKRIKTNKKEMNKYNRWNGKCKGEKEKGKKERKERE